MHHVRRSRHVDGTTREDDYRLVNFKHEIGRSELIFPTLWPCKSVAEGFSAPSRGISAGSNNIGFAWYSCNAPKSAPDNVLASGIFYLNDKMSELGSCYSCGRVVLFLGLVFIISILAFFLVFLLLFELLKDTL